MPRLFGVALFPLKKCNRIFVFRKSAAVLIFVRLILKAALFPAYTIWIVFAGLLHLWSICLTFVASTNGHLEIFCRPPVIEISGQYLLLRTDILQKTVLDASESLESLNSVLLSLKSR